MKLEVKKIDATCRELKFEVPKDRVSKKMEEILQEIGKSAYIKGFRPGKAPRHLVDAQHGKFAKEETLKQLIPEIYQEGLEREKITPMDLPEIHDVSFKDGMIAFCAKLDIRPEVKIKNYKGIVVERKSSVVSEEEIDKMLEFIKKGQGDKKVTLDDAFARGLGFPTLADFKLSLRRQMEMDRDRQNRVDIENQVIEYLLKEVSLPVPQSVMNRQLEHRVEETQKRLHSQGMKEEEIRKKEDEMRKELRPLVEKDLKIYLIMEHIAKQENIQIPEGENLFKKVMELLLREAKWEEIQKGGK
ncbi:MAG TPA: trigger factor [Candidatus Omnitrophota bacterium]|nr:trigger factor [Candidatus Omnitrophota bacterium]